MCMILALLGMILGSGAEAAPGEKGKMEFTSETFVLLVKGPKWSDADTAENRALMKGHLAHFEAQQQAGNLLVCGPFGDRDDPDLRGMCLYRTPVAETRALAEADPRVVAGHLKVKVMTIWHGAEAMTFPAAGPKAP